MKVDGSCHCGRVTFEAEVDPETAGICHCTDCQKMSGTAFRTGVTTVADGFKLLTGPLKTYVKTAESGNRRAQTFCPECGTQIYSSNLGDGPKTYRLRLGVVRQRAELAPKRQIWFRSAQPWIRDIASIPTIEKQQ
jgi:hypothetical protein